MKIRIFLPILICVSVAALSSCKKDEPASLSMLSSVVQVEAAGGRQDMSFKTNQSWYVRKPEDWIAVLPPSGEASGSYQVITVLVAENPSETERSAELTVIAGEKSATVAVKQAGKPAAPPQPSMTISAFRNQKVDDTTWYELTGVIASQPEEHYGNFFMTDDTGYIYVYGLCEKKVDRNDQSFSKLGLKPGDKVTIMTLRSEYNDAPQAGGTVPAYFVSKQEGTYRFGQKYSSTTASWMELPATSATDGLDLLVHRFQDGKRSYAAYYDYDNLVSSWVAYPLHGGNIGTGKRMEESSFPMDPLLPRSRQAYLPKGYKEGNAGKFDRGHQIPSADRLDWRVNLETFFSTNMTPQDNGLNSNAWGLLEDKVRGWARRSDTLYVVTGCVTKGSDRYVLDADDKKVTVPTGYYKALLRLSGGEYTGAAFWFDNVENKASSIQKSMSMSIDELEEKVGVDFFVNLPDDQEKDVEAAKPADAAWWWNN